MRNGGATTAGGRPVGGGLKQFSLTKAELDTLKQEEEGANPRVARVFIDEFKDVGEGRLYKGQYNKMTGERDGVGM